MPGWWWNMLGLAFGAGMGIAGMGMLFDMLVANPV